VFAAATHFEPAGSFRPTLGVPRVVHLLHRGSEKDPRQAVNPGTVHAVAELPSRFALPPGHDEAARRAALAEWVTDRRNPLTWRSIVNRAWQYHFGRGIVETASDFGRMGARPTHPELLDWLAAEFRDGGSAVPTPRSLKALHRLIVTSATYRQASADDPAKARIDAGNQYLWRANRQRLDAEAVRDAMLSISGPARPDAGRPGVPGVRVHGRPLAALRPCGGGPGRPGGPPPQRLSVRRPQRAGPADGDARLRRPVAGGPEAERDAHAAAGLALMNNRLSLRLAEHLAERARPLADTDAGRAAAAFRLALGRSPTEAERRTLDEVATRHGLPAACRVIFNLNEFVFVD
jgi:hypothetical protein